MNYRHSFHAGNFADVFKHIILTRILTYLNFKETPYFYLDTHAGIGLYNLNASDAQRTGEAVNGIGRLKSANIPPDITPLLKPYFETLVAAQQYGAQFYPGSPFVAQQITRAQDRLIFSELHKEDVHNLTRNCGLDQRTRILECDGFAALKAQSPPKERRGLVLIDPPFEQTSEFANIIKALNNAHKKWATGIYAIWYPIKGLRKINDFYDALKCTQIPKILSLELLIDDPNDTNILSGCGFAIINPPWVLKAEAEIILPFLADVLAQGRKGSWQAQWLQE